MRFPEETLMAYVDDEIDAETRATVEAAMRIDPEVKRYVERQQALRSKLKGTFDRVLHEPVPERLVETARAAEASNAGSDVVDLAAARAAKGEKMRRRWALPEWGAIAASLVIGLFVGQAWLRAPDQSPFSSRDGQLVAQGALERALTSQLAATQSADAAVHIGVSFRDKAGGYCRTFVLRKGEALAGLACHDRGAWRMEVLAQGEAASATPSGYRMAGADLPETVFKVVEARIEGDPLDSEQEAAAQLGNWD